MPTFGILLKAHVHDARRGCLVRFHWFDAAVVHGEFLEIGQNRQRQFGRPCIAAQLIGRMHILFDVYGRLLGLDEEFAHAADAAAIIRRFHRAADAQGILVNHILVGFRITCPVRYIPSQCRKHRVDELNACLRLIECTAFVGIQIGGEGFHQGFNDVRRAHKPSIVIGTLKPRNLYRILQGCIIHELIMGASRFRRRC